MFHDRHSHKPSLLAFIGGLLAAVAIGLAAYAAHGVSDPKAQSWLHTASLYALVHGAALAVLGPISERLLARFGLFLLMIGTLFFSGSLVGNVLAGWPTPLAPVGGVTMMLGWVVIGFNGLRR